MLDWPAGKRFFAWRDERWVPTVSVRVEHFPKSGMARLLEAIACRHEMDPETGGQRVTFSPEGMLFDGGSKPGFSWALIGHPWADYLLAYVDHDAQWSAAQTAFRSGEISAGEYGRRLRLADRDFRANQLWLKRNLLGKAGSRWERAVIRVKYQTVRLHARWRVWRDRRDLGNVAVISDGRTGGGDAEAAV